MVVEPGAREVTMTSCWPEIEGDAPPHRSTAQMLLAGAGFAAVTIAVAVGGSVINAGSMDWYDELERPGFTPPGATFGIVWTILYVLIAVAGWLAWRAARRPDPTIAWGVQMALNFAWTAVFFGLQAPLAGLFVILALVVAIVVNIVLDARVSRPAAWMLAPYLAWCCFATALNTAFVILN